MSSPVIRTLVPYMLSFGGGVHRVLREGLPELEQTRGLRVEYSELSDNQEDMLKMEHRGVPVVRGLGPRAGGILSGRRGLARAVDFLVAVPRVIRIISRLSNAMRQYQVVYVHGYRELVFVAAANALLGRKRPALVWHCHGIGDDSPPPLTMRLANSCDLVIGVSNSVVQRLEEIGISSQKLRTVYNAARLYKVLDNPEPNLALPSGSAKTILVASAALRSTKGAHLVLEALARLPVTTSFWLTGDTSDEYARDYTASLIRLSQELGVRDRFHLLGRRSDILQVMQRADVVVVPSICREGFGLVAAEAMLLGKPVIVSNRGGLPEVVGSTDNGWIFDPDVDGDLTRCLMEALGDSEHVQLVVKGALERAKTLFTYERWAREVSEILEMAAHMRAAALTGLTFRTSPSRYLGEDLIRFSKR